jgi:hypothetical protein
MKIIFDILTPFGCLAAFFWGVWQYFHSKSLDVFDRYCEKYNRIVTPEIWDDWTKALKQWPLDDKTPGNKVLIQQLERAMLAYLNLVWEEFYLHDEGLIRKGAWKAWRSCIDKTIHTDFACSVLMKYCNHFSEFNPASGSHKIATELDIKSLDLPVANQ